MVECINKRCKRSMKVRTTSSYYSKDCEPDDVVDQTKYKGTLRKMNSDD